MSLTIRPMQNRDAPAVAALLIGSHDTIYGRETYTELLHRNNKTRESEIAAIIEFYNKNGTRNPLDKGLDRVVMEIAETGQIVGFASFGAIDDIGPPRHRLNQTHIHENWRGCGLGRTLLAHQARALARENLLKVGLNVYSENRGAIALYERLGAKIIGETTASIMGTPFPHKLMVWENIGTDFNWALVPAHIPVPGSARHENTTTGPAPG